MDDSSGCSLLYGNSPILVIGLGNPLLGDDGVGWRVAEQVQRQFHDTGHNVEFDCLALGGLHLMERMVGYDRVILIDALSTGQHPPGTLHIGSINDLPDSGLGHFNSAHDITLQTALSVGRVLGLPLPEDVTILGIEAQCRFEFTEEITPTVLAAIPQMVDKVTALLHRLFQQEQPI
jgi:hydrogenase maturation protease